MLRPIYSSRVKSRPRRQGGATLVEVLVTVVVISVGLLGIAGLQMVSLRNAHASAMRSQATALANYIIDRMRANGPAANAGAYNVALGGSLPVTSQAGRDVTAWKTLVTATLTSQSAGVADGAINVAGNVATITIAWGERAFSVDGTTDPGVVDLQFVTQTEI